MGMGISRYALVMFKPFVVAASGDPTYPSVMRFVMATIGVSVDRHTCPICGKSCRTPRHLKQHISRVHGDLIDDLVRKFYEERMKKSSFEI